MVDRPRVVSAFDAKTRLSELLRETEQGASFIIERRGKQVARLLPPEKGSAGLELGELLDCFRRIRESIPGTVSVRALVEEGRRI
jgi:prevent-host-death family protein